MVRAFADPVIDPENIVLPWLDVFIPGRHAFKTACQYKSRDRTPAQVFIVLGPAPSSYFIVRWKVKRDDQDVQRLIFQLRSQAFLALMKKL